MDLPYRRRPGAATEASGKLLEQTLLDGVQMACNRRRRRHDVSGANCARDSFVVVAGNLDDSRDRGLVLRGVEHLREIVGLEQRVEHASVQLAEETIARRTRHTPVELTVERPKTQDRQLGSELRGNR